MPDPVLEAIAAGRSNVESRSDAIEAVLSQASVVGIEKALANFGGPLSETDRRLLSSLTADDVRNLAGVRAKLGALARAAADNNNNNFY